MGQETIAVDFDDLKDLKTEEAREEEPSGEPVKAIVRVKEPGYVPEGVQVRARIDDQMFTAEMPASRVRALREDARVQSVEVSKLLPKID